MNIKGWIYARVVLGTAVLLHLIRAPFQPRGAGSRWLKAISQENLGKTPEGNWRDAPAASRCIQCGLCAALAPESPTRFDHLIAGQSRRPEDAPWASKAASVLRTHAAALKVVCPVGVDAEAVAALTERNARVLFQAANPEG